jgi:hypothetical protein
VKFSPAEPQFFIKYADLPIEIKHKVWEYPVQHLAGQIIPVTLIPPKDDGDMSPYFSPQLHHPLFYNTIALRDVL